MIAHDISSGIFLLHQLRIPCHQAAKTEKRGLDSVVLQDSEHGRGVERIGPVIKG
jgi:hypothetical protein